MNTDFHELTAELRLNLRRYDLRENERLVAEALVDLSFAISAPAAVVRHLDQLAALTGIRLDRVRAALEELQRMQIIADIATDDRGVTFYLQPDVDLWKCRPRVDGLVAAAITRDLAAEAKRDPAQFDLIPPDSNLDRELSKLACLPASEIRKPLAAGLPKNGNPLNACASALFPKRGNPPITIVRVRDTVKELSKGALPKNGNGDGGFKPANVPREPFTANPERWSESPSPIRADRSKDYVDPASLAERDLMERLRRALGDEQLAAHGGAWTMKCRRMPKLVRLALNEIETRHDIRDPLHFALDLMKRGPRDYPTLCKTAAHSQPTTAHSQHP